MVLRFWDGERSGSSQVQSWKVPRNKVKHNSWLGSYHEARAHLKHSYDYSTSFLLPVAMGSDGGHCSFVLLAEFDILAGAQLKYQFPQPLGVDER